MTFEQTLYQQVCAVIPDMTTRNFSRLCGRSDNYYCSTQSQHLQMSIAALVHLAEAIECLEALGRTRTSATAVQAMLAEEIAARRNTISTGSFTVQRLIARAIAKRAYERDQQYNLPPVTMGWA